MSSSLGPAMITAFDTHSPKVETLLEKYPICSPDDFKILLQDQFLRGVHASWTDSILKGLASQLGTQQDIAEALGLKDRTSVSQMKRSETMDGVRLTAALSLYPNLINTPTTEMAILFGYSRATSYVKSLAYNDQAIQGSMKPQEFSYLVGVPSDDQWDSAIRHPNATEIRFIAKRIVTDWSLNKNDSFNNYLRCRPEQLVLMLQELFQKWADFGVITLCSIPEYIPVNQ